MKKLCTVLAVALALSLLPACGIGEPADREIDIEAEPESFVMNEPEFTGNTKNGDPQFRLSWSKVKDAGYYELYIYSEADGCAYRDRLTPTENSCTVTLLNFEGKYDTDTAAYRFKVRPLYAGSKPWSGVWEIDLSDGKYTVLPDAKDFEQPAGAAGSSPSGAKAQPLPDVFPEKLSVYEAHKKGLEDIDLSSVAGLNVVVNHCEYGEPVQEITDPDVVNAVLEVVRNMTVTEKHDSISSTGTYYGYSFYTAGGEYLFGFAIQDGLLMENDGRYSVTGIDALLSVEGIKLAADWDEYWEEYSAAADDYNASVKDRAANVFDASGYEAHLLYEGIDSAELCSASVRGDEYRGIGEFNTNDAQQIRAMFDALASAELTAGAADSPKGQSWRVTFGFYLPGDGFGRSVTLSFTGSRLKGASGDYDVTGLEALFSSVDGEVMTDLLNNRDMTVPVPVY